MRSSSGGPSARRRIPRRPPAQSRTKSVPSARGKPFPARRHRRSTSPRRIEDLEHVRDLLDSDPVGNAVTWDRVFQQPNYEVSAEGYVRRRIETGPTAAVYDDGRPVAWALTHMVTDRVGIVGMVHVLEAYRRKGLAHAVVAAISQDLIRAGKTPALHAYVDNVASLSLFPTLGFRRVRRQVWGDAVFR